MNDREQECYYCIALTQIPHIGIRGAKRLYQAVGNATDIFRYRKELPERVPDLHHSVLEWLDCPEALKRAEKEMEFIDKNRIDFYLLSDDTYPKRFRDCEDSPITLFGKGKYQLNAPRIINMVGTRQADDYGKTFCSRFVKELKQLCPDVVIVSGLAYGIDIASHRAAVDNKMTTIGVLAHGLDRIYPSQHRATAVRMLENGGLLTEFISGTNPDAFNFVSRNRIIAGISDATIVVQSAAKGGSLITAEIAQSYNRDCFAIPGRVDDSLSVGCNKLIHDNRAALLLNADDLVQYMQWGSADKKKKQVQRTFLPDLNEAEQKIVRLLQERGNLQINTLAIETEIPIYKMANHLFELEMKGVIKAMAGSMYQLLK